jgi:protein-S-isoprenylcysteine O-methyltransferase Ste14
MNKKLAASIAAAIIIVGLISVLFLLASFLLNVLGLPRFIGLPVPLRVAGGLSMGAGFAVALWLFKYRKPGAMLVSTYYTFRKMFTGIPIRQMAGRTESLIIEGPQKYVRHPLYLGAVLLFLGWGLLTGSGVDLIATLFILLWFLLVQIPFEEKEMRALFGERYAEYTRDTPVLVPFTRRKSR